MLPASTFTPERADPEDYEGLEFGEFVHRSMPLAFDFAGVYQQSHQAAVDPLVESYTALWRAGHGFRKKGTTGLVPLFREIRQRASDPEDNRAPVDLNGWFSIENLKESERTVLVLALRYQMSPDVAAEILDTTTDQAGQAYLAAKTTAWELADAMHLWQQGREDCLRLRDLGRGRPADESLVTPILRHADTCDICKPKLGTGPDPLRNLPSAPGDVPPRMVRREVVDGLAKNGIPTSSDETGGFGARVRRATGGIGAWWSGATPMMRAGTIAAALVVIALVVVLLANALSGDGSADDTASGGPDTTASDGTGDTPETVPADPGAVPPQITVFSVQPTLDESGAEPAYDVAIVWESTGADRSEIVLPWQEEIVNAEASGTFPAVDVPPGLYEVVLRVFGPGGVTSRAEQIVLADPGS